MQFFNFTFTPLTFDDGKGDHRVFPRHGAVPMAKSAFGDVEIDEAGLPVVDGAPQQLTDLGKTFHVPPGSTVFISTIAAECIARGLTTDPDYVAKVFGTNDVYVRVPDSGKSAVREVIDGAEVIKHVTRFIRWRYDATQNIK